MRNVSVNVHGSAVSTAGPVTIATPAESVTVELDVRTSPGELQATASRQHIANTGTDRAVAYGMN